AFTIQVGQVLDRQALCDFADRTGYLHDERIDEPGEIAFLGEVVDVFAPTAPSPCRITFDEDDRVSDIKTFDPVSQRTVRAVAGLTLTPASEWIAHGGDASGDEPCLASAYGATLSDIFSLCAGWRLLLEGDSAARFEQVRVQIDDAWEARCAFDTADAGTPTRPDKLYLNKDEISARLAPADRLDLADVEPAPLIFKEPSPGRALKTLLEELRGDGTLILTGLAHEQRIISRLLKRCRIAPAVKIERWEEIYADGAAGLSTIEADLDAGFLLRSENRLILTPSDLLGARVAQHRREAADPFGETEIRIGDVVIHEDHGVGVLQALEAVDVDGAQREVLRLEYQGGDTVLAPIEEFDRIWRYGSEPSAVTLDRLHGEGWIKRRAEVSAQIDKAAAQMVDQAKVRASHTTDRVTPPKAAYARFSAGFPFPETVDQTAAIDAVMDDLDAGRPMNRLVCGDVGFGKTEVALRAAAAVALSGRQVIFAAPTTVLARQHFETFRSRFAGAGVEVAHLSGLVGNKEAQTVRAGLADGSIGIVIGTQSLADNDLNFADLALVMIDEEHRFGAAMKAELAAKAPHLLTFSATPIPRTLQGALVGVQDVTIIASPPARRRPIRTFLSEFDPASLRTMLLREKARGGQSFIVAPRIQDLKPLE
ncbi:hypothetical protein LTR94_025648, partial [Friedmanniomyces endolithicus]